MSDNSDVDRVPIRRPHYLKLAIQIAVIAVATWMIFYFMREYASDISNLRNLSVADVLLIGAWSFVSYTAYAYAVFVALISLGLKKLGPYDWIKIYFVSRLANLFVTQGGNVFRLLVLKKKYGFSYTKSTGVTGFLLWVNALIALLASLVVLAGTEKTSFMLGLSIFDWFVFITLVLLVGPPATAWAIISFRDSPVWESRFLRPVSDMARFFVATLRNLAVFSRITLLSIVHFIFFVGVNYFTFRAIGQPIGLAAVCLFTTAFVFTRYVNVVPGNLGISELVAGIVSEQMGVGFGNGLLVSGIVRIVEVVMILLIGALYGKVLAYNYLRN
jgi:uncharacterized membrane protein YbhN (UPF0104 family)